MYDRVLIMSGLHNIEKSLLHILDRTSWIKTVDDFLKTPAGVDALDIAAVRLMANGGMTTVQQIITDLEKQEHDED